MKDLLNRIHARVGDLWWYSAMIFLACRTGDVIQAFIGLWLVPKYVGPQELGAVLPLQQLSSFLTVPLAVVAVVFSKFVNTYATRGEYGKVKSFIHDVFTVSFVLFVVCIAGAYLVMPFFYERLRIASGSLTFLILVCGLVGNVGAVIASAQQGLKRFKTMSLMTLVSAPIRLVTMLVAMPFRALSGYILGQTTPGATTSLLSVLDIRKALRPYAPDTTWRKDLPEIWRYLWPIAIYTALNTFNATLSNTIYRQRLPELESAANYLLSRFAEIGGYVGCSLLVVLFPLASEAHESGNGGNALLKRMLIPNIIIPVSLAVVFYFAAPFIFSLNAEWRAYSDFAGLLPLLTLTVGVAAISLSIVTVETACKRFGAAYFFVAYHFVATGLLAFLSGCEFFRGILPDRLVDGVAALKFNSLFAYSWYGFFITLLLAVILTAWRFGRGRRS